MKRGLFTVALLVACSVPDGSPPIISQGQPSPPNLTLLDTNVVVVRGESTPIRLQISASMLSTPEITLALGPLPSGLSATSATWDDFESTDVTLQLSAAPDAPATRLTFEVHAISDGTIVSSTTGSLAVSSVAGSPDMTFGTNGVLELPTLVGPIGIVPTSNDTFVIGGSNTDLSNAVLTRIHADATLDTSFGASGYAISSGVGASIAVRLDGRIALGTSDGKNGEVVTFDANGTELSKVAVPFVPSAIAWAGHAMFVGGQFDLAYIDASNTIVTDKLPFTVMRISGVNDTSAIVGGGSSYGGIVAKCVVAGSSISFDMSYGTGGSDALVENAPVTGMTTSSSGETIVSYGSLGAGIARISPSGVVDAASSLGIETHPMTAVASTPGDEAIFVSQASSSTTSADIPALVARFTASGALDDTFGTYGTTLTQLSDASLTPVGVVLNAAGNRAYVLGRLDRGAAQRAFLARYRLAP